MGLADERYIVLTTYRRDGRAVATPVWIVGLGDDEVGFTTGSQSGKLKRLAHTARVTVQPSNARGKLKPGSSPVEASARRATDAELERIRTAVAAKYGLMAKLTKAFGQLVRTLLRKPVAYADTGVVITLPSGS